MVEQHPHILKINSTTIITEAYQDEQGDWVIPAPGETESISVPCRAQENLKEAKVVGVDGTKIDFSYMVFMPVDCPEVLTNAAIEIFDDGKLIISNTVKRFHRGQINARLWV